MDLTQLSQMVSWLDEEHRRDREGLARLDQRLQTMTVENQEQSRRIQDLEGRLANYQAQLSRFTQLEQALQQLKNEIVAMVNKEAEARLQNERDSERNRLSERESLSRGIAEIRKELPRLARVEEELVTRQAEDQRLGEMVMAQRQSINNVSKDLDERTRSLPYVAEQRAQDNKRIAQSQAEIVELFKRTDVIPAKFAVMDERVQRLERDLLRVTPIPEQIRRDQQTFLENQKLAEVERGRQVQQWSEESAEHVRQIDAFSLRLREFTVQHETAGRALVAFEEFKGQLAHDQKQVAELQRLAEERQRRELSSWQSENEQRWKKEMLGWDYAVGEQQKINQKVMDRFPMLEKTADWVKGQIEALWQLEQEMAGQQVQETQRLLGTVGKAVEARAKLEL